MNLNSIARYLEPSLKELGETIGQTHFSGANADAWAQVIGGLIIQGGKVTVPAGASLVVSYSAVYPKQVLGIFAQAIAAAVVAGWAVNPTGTPLVSFTIYNPAGADRDYYWWAIGV
jgi:hypothetical protein